jgi:hypothetical protein
METRRQSGMSGVYHEGLSNCKDNGFEIKVGRTKVPVLIVPEFRDLVPPLAGPELTALRDSLTEVDEKSGKISSKICLNPIFVGRIGKDEKTAEHILLDGHNRYAILLSNWRQRFKVLYEQGEQPFLSPPYNIIVLTNREAAKLWILENQVSRRNLTDDQRAIILNEIRERRSKVVRAVQLANARRVSDKTTETQKPTAKVQPIDTRKAVAAQAKISERKLRAAQEVKKASPELATHVRAGLLTLKQAKQAIAKVTPAPPQKALDSDGRYRKLHSFVGNLYQDVPAPDRPAEIRKHVQQILEDYC